MMIMMTMIMIMMTMMTMMMTNSVYGPVEASDGVFLLSTLLLRNTQTHLIIFDYNDDDPYKILATHILGVSE